MPFLRSSALGLVLAMTALGAMPPAAAQAQVSINISVNFAPPPLPVYDQPPIVEADYIWIPGYWAWDDDDYDYYWVPGTWAPAPRPGYLWTPAWWGWSDGVYVFHQGYWGPQIGYYGGVVYGHGYNGSGYDGGYWNNNHFYYNRTVNNVTNVHITNVYNKTVIVNKVTNASFNGPGGVNAQPTPQQIAYQREAHLPPTPVQMRHIQAAAAMPALRASANHGAPPIAAAAKPAAFSGPGIVRAMHPGGAYHPPAAVIQRQQQMRAAHGNMPAPGAPHPQPGGHEPGTPQPERDAHFDHAAPPSEGHPAVQGGPAYEHGGQPPAEHPHAMPHPAHDGYGQPSAPPHKTMRSEENRPEQTRPEAPRPEAPRPEARPAQPRPAPHARPPAPHQPPHKRPPDDKHKDEH